MPTIFKLTCLPLQVFLGSLKTFYDEENDGENENWFLHRDESFRIYLKQIFDEEWKGNLLFNYNLQVPINKTLVWSLLNTQADGSNKCFYFCLSEPQTLFVAKLFKLGVLHTFSFWPWVKGVGWVGDGGYIRFGIKSVFYSILVSSTFSWLSGSNRPSYHAVAGSILTVGPT